MFEEMDKLIKEFFEACDEIIDEAKNGKKSKSQIFGSGCSNIG